MMLPYQILSLVALLVGAFYWSRRAAKDAKLAPIFATSIAGAIFGAKAGYLMAEGIQNWRSSGQIFDLIAGKTIVGGLIGGYLGVEVMKRVLRYPYVTGDLFAALVPLSIAIGRIGCILAGCCQGKVCPLRWYTLIDSAGLVRWPAAQVELVFNLGCVLTFSILRRRELGRGQHFHLYMIAYGLFRFLHEFMREPGASWTALNGYQYQSIVLALLGLRGLILRAKSPNSSLAPTQTC
ncbi:MAG: prolipoprotein diacylglyceryl transferase [Oligoflexia bacterium]|nr:prolipoprotein diacylglyceryl transferase [Oligoflexia bacterium]